MYIPPSPSLRFSDLLDSPPKTHALFPLVEGQPRVGFYYRGCGAIWSLQRTFSLKPDDTVLLPAYLCGEVIEVFAAMDLRLEFYAIDGRCRFDVREIEGKIGPSTKLLYVVHYFGFPQDVEAIQSLARRKLVPLVEDCAHGLFGRCGDRWLGEFGDASIFSLKKSLPVPDGGALLVNHPSLKPPTPLPIHHRTSGLFRTVKLIAKQAFWRLQYAPPTKLPNPGVPTNDSSHGVARTACLDRGAMSRISLRVLKNCDQDRIASVRRSNFSYYAKHVGRIRGAEPLHREMPDGVVPFSFPVLVEDRDRVREQMWARGMPLNSGFPEAPSMLVAMGLSPSAFPGTTMLARRLLELPVHQDLQEPHLQAILEAMERVVVQNGMAVPSAL